MAWWIDSEVFKQMENAMVEATVDAILGAPNAPVNALPEYLVWSEDADGNIDTLVMACWTWDEAMKVARGSAIIMGSPTRIVTLV